MKRAFVFMMTISMVSFISCGNSSSPDHTNSRAGKKMDSMVERARSAIGNAADSVAHGAQNAVHSLKTTRDSGVKSDS